MSGIQQVWNLIDISDDETREYAPRIDVRKMDSRVKMWKLQLKLTQKLTSPGLVFLCSCNLLAQRGGVHECSIRQ